MKNMLQLLLWMTILLVALSRTLIGDTGNTAMGGPPEIENGSYFFDDFESGLGNWIVSGQDWDLTESDYRSASQSLTDSRGSNYESNLNALQCQRYSMNLSRASSSILNF